MFQSRPALRLVLIFSAGIILATWISSPPLYLFALTVITVFISAILFWKDTWIVFAEIVLQCAVILLGMFLQTFQQSNFNSRELEPHSTDEPVMLFGAIDSEPAQQERRMSCVVRTDSIIRQGKIDRDSRRLMIMLRYEKTDRSTEEIKFGKKIEVHGILEPFPFQRNPGEFDYGKYLALNDIQGIVTIKGLDNVRIRGEGDGNSFQAWIYSVQQALYRIIDRLHTPRHASFLKGIIFGYRADIPSDVKQSFLDTGTIHILAVSGSNVAFVALIFFSVLGFFRLPRIAVIAATILGLIVYMLITGSSASVVRATIMAIVLLCGTLFERKADIYNSISVAALILLFWNTNTLFDVGFQLSFAAVISIVYFYPRLESLIKKIPERFEEIKAVDAVLKLFAVSLAAQLGTVPFTAYYFGHVSIISLVANIPVVPISGINTFIGAAEIISYPMSPWIAKLYASVNDFLVWFLLGFVKQASSAPFAYLEAWHFTAVFVVGYYILVIGIFNLNLPRVRAWLLIMVLAFSNYVLYSNIVSLAHPKCTATVLDVGQGDAILIEFPNTKRMLIDAGPLSQKFDAGERTIVPFLKRNGISKLDYLLITHSHSDHMGGAGSVLKLLQIDTIIMASPAAANHQVKDVLEIAEARHSGIKTVQAGNQIQIDSNARVYVLHPDSNHIAERNMNNSSIVLKIVYGNSSLMLVGDAEVAVEHRIIPKYGAFLSSDILKAGHHGSISSTSEEFLKLVRPQTVLISVGNHNKFRHPSPFTLWRMKANLIDIQRTDKLGAIILESDGMKWTKKEWR
ncbi:MAG: DNA internalization-related competence protein ComEC/Rec2 [Ignavibacteriales bacterium]|nr:DNA internalization-related competence protein ComEC/Rec2 [Ignavibacteriales bacterium]